MSDVRVDNSRGPRHGEVVTRRRSWPALYKKRILEEVDAAPQGEKGLILRREGLYSSTITKWRQQRDAGALEGLTSRKRGPKGKPKDIAENERLAIALNDDIINHQAA